jgi:hypothetical protein
VHHEVSTFDFDIQSYRKESTSNILRFQHCITVILIAKKGGMCTANQLLKEAGKMRRGRLIKIVMYRTNSTRNGLRMNNQQDTSNIKNFYFVTKIYMFRASSVPIIRSYQLYSMVCGRCLGSGHITCMKYTNCHLYS